MCCRSLLTGLCLLWGAVLQAHPFHTSLTEIEHNPVEQVLEIGVRLSPVDLEEALTAYAGENIVIDGSDRHDALLMEYLRAKLIFYRSAAAEQGGNEKLPLQWVGKQSQVKHIWLFVTVPWQSGELLLDNRLLLALFPEQINTVSVIRDGKKSSHQLTSQTNTLKFSP